MKTNKILALVLAVAMVFGMMSMVVSADETTAVAQIGNEYYDSFEAAANAIKTDGSDTLIKLLKDVESPKVVEFVYGEGDIVFTADRPVTVKQTVLGSDWGFVDSKDINIVIDKNVTFDIYDNASGLYVYYGPSLMINGAVTGGQNWGALYLFNGNHKVSETGKVSAGRVQLGYNSFEAKGEIDTNYLLVEGGIFTADGATVDAGVIYDNNNGGQRWGASEFVIKNGAQVTTDKLTLSYEDSELIMDTSSSLNAAKIEGKGTIYIDAANYKDGESPISGNVSGFVGEIKIINDKKGNLKIVVDENDNVSLRKEVASAKDANGNVVIYTSLQAAVDAVVNGETITLLDDIKQKDGVIIKDKNLVIDLAGYAFEVSEGSNTVNRNLLIKGNSVVTIKNGTMIAAGELTSGTYGTVRTEDTANVTLEKLKLYNYRGNGLNIKGLSGTKITISDTEIYSVYGGGIESAGAEIEVSDVVVDQKGMWNAPYNSMAISVNGGGKVTVNSGTYSTEPLKAEDANNQGSSHGSWAAGVLNSGGTLVINGGTFENGNYGDDALATNARGLLFADKSGVIEVNGGTFNALKDIFDLQNNSGTLPNPKATVKGGTFSTAPTTTANGYNSNLITIPDGYVVEPGVNGKFHVVEKAVLVDEIELDFVDVTATDAEGEKIYNINLTASGKVINRLNSVDLTFLFTQVDEGKNDFEIVASNSEVAINPVDNSKVRYEFHYNGKTDVDTDTAATITIGQVKFTGYGKFSFAADSSVKTNAAHATKLFDNIVDTFVPGGVLEDGTQVGTFDVSDDDITGIEIAVPTRKLTINVKFPNNIVDNKADYQDMMVTINGGELEEAINISLGGALADQTYTVERDLTVNRTYVVTVSGEGYRTARYSVNLNNHKTLNFWNNVMDEEDYIEEGKGSKMVANYLAGDIVADNNINIFDLSAVVSYFGEVDLKTAKPEFVKYDLNRDGKIDSKDVALVLVSWNN